jgi:hypothetical protein
MQFINDIRAHLEDFESEAKAEIHNFLNFLETRYKKPSPAVPAEVTSVPAPVNSSTYTAPVASAPAPEAPIDTPVEAPEATPAPEATAPAETPVETPVEAPVEAPATPEATAPEAPAEAPAETPAQ